MQRHTHLVYEHLRLRLQDWNEYHLHWMVSHGTSPFALWRQHQFSDICNFSRRCLLSKLLKLVGLSIESAFKEEIANRRDWLDLNSWVIQWVEGFRLQYITLRRPKPLKPFSSEKKQPWSPPRFWIKSEKSLWDWFFSFKQHKAKPGDSGDIEWSLHSFQGASVFFRHNSKSLRTWTCSGIDTWCDTCIPSGIDTCISTRFYFTTRCHQL